MKRPPLSSACLAKLSSFIAPVLQGLDAFETPSKQLRKEHAAKILGYKNFGDARYQADKTPFPRPSSITRAQLHAIIAIGIAKHTGLPVREAARRAILSKTSLLAVDALTVEAQLESASGEDKSSKRSGELEPCIAQLLNAGAPAFKLAVTRDEQVFKWELAQCLFELYRLIPESDKQAAFGISEATPVQTFLREEVVPSCWIPLADALRDGLQIPFHRVVWLHAEDGTYLGRTLQHTIHGGVGTRLLITDEEVVKGQVDLLFDRPQFGGSSLERIMLDRPLCDLPVYESQPRYSGLNSVTDMAEVSVAASSLLGPLPGLKAGYLLLSTARTQPQQIWSIDGNSCCVDLDRQNYAQFGYYETTTWLTDKDFPHLFPGLTPETRDPYPFKPTRKFIPDDAEAFGGRLQTVLLWKYTEASQWVEDAFLSGVFFERVLHECAMNRVEEFCERTHLEAKANLPQEDHDSLDEAMQRRVKDYVRLDDALEAFGTYSLSEASLFRYAFTETEGERPEKVILAALALRASAVASNRDFEPLYCESALVAVASWLMDLITFDQVYDTAEVFQHDLLALEAHTARINQLRPVVAWHKQRAKLARSLGYAYVGDSITDQAAVRSAVAVA